MPPVGSTVFWGLFTVTWLYYYPQPKLEEEHAAHDISPDLEADGHDDHDEHAAATPAHKAAAAPALARRVRAKDTEPGMDH